MAAAVVVLSIVVGLLLLCISKMLTYNWDQEMKIWQYEKEREAIRQLDDAYEHARIAQSFNIDNLYLPAIEMPSYK